MKETNDYDEDSDKYIISGMPLNFEPQASGLGEFFFINMKKFKDRVAQYISDTGEEETYEELLVKSVRVACHLKARNLKKGEVVAICSINQKYCAVSVIASLFLNIPVSSLHPALSSLLAVHLLKEVKPSIVFVTPDAVDLIETSLNEAGLTAELIVYGTSNTHTEFSSLLKPHDDEDKFVPTENTDIRDTIIIIFSSGTTSLPKGIMLSHYAIMAQACLLNKSDFVGDVFLHYSTYYWVSAILFRTATAQTGAAVVVVDTFEPLDFWRIITKFKVTHFFTTPSLVFDLKKQGRPKDVNTTNFRYLMTAGARITQKQLIEVKALFPETGVFQGYGQTEMAGTITGHLINTDIHPLSHSKLSSVGKIAYGVQGKVVDTNTGKMCGPNQKGEMCVKGECMMNGYYNRDSSETFDGDGWLKTGDIVYYDEDRYFYIVDRIKDMLKYKCWHIAPSIIEQLLITHPAVMHAVVIGIPHEEDGELPMAIIIPKESAKKSITSEEIMKFVQERVDDKMWLHGGVLFVDSYPMTPTGKISRTEIRRLILNDDIQKLGITKN